MRPVPDGQPQTVVAVTIPDEPPDGSIVIARGLDGNVWQRKDDERWHNKHWGPNWFPACKWWDFRANDDSRAPLPWKDFIAKIGPIHILRWGDGKPPEEAK